MPGAVNCAVENTCISTDYCGNVKHVCTAHNAHTQTHKMYILSSLDTCTALALQMDN